jgi:hypothetical protein
MHCRLCINCYGNGHRKWDRGGGATLTPVHTHTLTSQFRSSLYIDDSAQRRQCIVLQVPTCVILTAKWEERGNIDEQKRSRAHAKPKSFVVPSQTVAEVNHEPDSVL